MSCTISSEVLPIFTLTLQPVSFSNDDTQSTLGSLEPFSTYPAQAIRLRAPSPFPTVAGSAFVPLLPPEPPLLPQPAATNARTAPTAMPTMSRLLLRVLMVSPEG